MRARPLVLSVPLALLGACPSSVAEPSPRPEDTPPEAAPQERKDPALAHAHARALQRLRDAALPALDAFDPVAASALGRGPLHAPPVARASRQALRAKLGPARREREGIDPAELSPEQAMLLRALEHATYLIDDELAGKTPLRTEPGAYLDRLAPLVDLIERRLSERAQDPAGTDAALESIATELREARAQLGGVSPAAAAAAIEDARALADRLRRLPSLADPGDAPTASASAAATEADALREHLLAIETRLPAARAAARGVVLPPSADPNAVRRLPDPLGPDALADALAAEAITEPPSVLLSRLVPQIARLSAMLDALPTTAAGTATPVTLERCAEAWRPIEAWVKTQPPLAAATLDCEAFARRHGDIPFDDADLKIAIAVDGVVVPIREARRREVDAALALVAGAITPHAQRDAMAISVLAGAGEAAAQRRAIKRARDATCLAGAALVVHGEPDAALEVAHRLGAGCAHRTSAAWSADALARPHRSLRGLGFSLLGTGPADALAMQRFWWAPMGLVRSLAVPPDVTRAEPAPPLTKIEPLSPTDPEPAR